MDKKDRKQPYKHDWKGHCDPGMSKLYNTTTFSVGIFQWIPSVRGGKLKKSAVKYRVKGVLSNPKPVHKRAEELCDFFDAGGALTRKSEVAKDETL